MREEKKASSKIDIPAVYEDVRRAYADMGYPVSGDRLVLSEQPTYTNGKPVPAYELSPNESGGNIQHDGTVRINPRYRAVMRHWKLKGPGRDFLRLIIGHELGHHIDRSVLSKPERAEERKRLLKEIAKEKFHTGYTDSYGPDTDPRKLNKELLAEYLAYMVRRKLEKKAAFEIRDGDYASVKSVYDSLSNKEKNYVTPGRRIYKDLPKNLVSRSVAYDMGKPVAFTDIVGMFPHGTAAFETAVDSEHRGNGLSEELSVDAFRKVFERIKENRKRNPEDMERWAKIKRFAWDVLDDNDASAHIAQKLKFKERHGHPDGWRRFIMSYRDAERLYGEKFAEYTPSDEELRRIYEVLQADARLDGKVSGLGFGRGGDAYRRAAAKLRVMELVKVLQDGKRIRNRIVHTPGYIPSEQDAQRAIVEYGKAERRLSEIARG